MSKSWIGVDLDGTLAFYDEWRGEDHIGYVIQPMRDRVLDWIAKGTTVKIFTARANSGEGQKDVIRRWLRDNGLPELEITATKDYLMIALWDDRCTQVIPNTGIPAAAERKE